MSVLMPAAIVLIVCKTVIAGPPDQNAGYTGSENLAWATEGSMMVCRRKEISLYDQSVAQGAAPEAFTMQRCQRSGIMLGAQWNASHRGSSYRYWRVACPTPIIDTKTGAIIAWQMPDCGKRGTVICENDVVI